jgi:hypothetical protein
MTGPHSRSARDVVEELFRRQRTGDDTVLDDHPDGDPRAEY